MTRREFLVLLGGAAIVPPHLTLAEPARAAGTIAARLVGAWQFQSSVSLRGDGTASDRWGANPKGTVMFDGSGHFVQVIMGEESRFFGAKSFFSFGTYSVDESAKTIITHIEGSSNAKLNGTTQRRLVTMLTDIELTYVNLSNSNGATVEAHWRRLKDADTEASAAVK